MKKIVALLLSGVMLSSLVLCGCTPKETEVNDPIGSEEVTTEAGFVDPGNRLNEKNLMKAQKYCASVDPDGDEGVPAFIDGIRGNGSTIVNDDLVFFNYSSLDGDSLDINVHRDTGEVNFSIDMMYRDERYSANANFYLGGFEEFFDKVCADPESVEPSNTSALNFYKEDLKNDFPIIFSRMIAFSDVALSEAGLGFKDLGIDLGDKYRAIDPKQRTSKEVEVTDEHKFENGYCTDCGIAWTKHFYQLIKKFAKPVVDTGENTIKGQKSASMISPADELLYREYSDSNVGLFYHHVDIDNDAGIEKSDWCLISLYTDDFIDIQYHYKQQKFYNGGDVFTYYVLIQAKPGEVDKVFESKESYMKCVKVNLTVFRDGRPVDTFSDLTDENIRRKLEADGLTYFTKDEIIDRFWDYHSAFFTSLENGMVWMKTSLKDFGFNWKG